MDIKPTNYIITNSFIWWYSFGTLHRVVQCSDVSENILPPSSGWKLIWLNIEERRMNIVCIGRFSPYHCSIQPDEFRHPEDGGSTFFRNIGPFNHYTVQKPQKHYHHLMINNRREGLKTCNMALHNPYCELGAARQEELLNAYQHFSPKPWKEDKSLNVGRCILLKWILRMSNARMWTGIVWGKRALRKLGSSRFWRPYVSTPRNEKRKYLEETPAWSDAMDQAGTQAYTEEISPSYKSGMQANKKLATDNRTCKLIVTILVIWPWSMLGVTTDGRLLCRW